MRLVTAGGYGEDPISPVSSGEIKMDTLGRNRKYSGNAGEGSGEKQTRRLHLSNTPPKAESEIFWFQIFFVISTSYLIKE